MVHITGLEQKVHWKGHPRDANIGIVRPRSTPIDSFESKYLLIGTRSQAGFGISSNFTIRFLFSVFTNLSLSLTTNPAILSQEELESMAFAISTIVSSPSPKAIASKSLHCSKQSSKQ